MTALRAGRETGIAASDDPACRPVKPRPAESVRAPLPRRTLLSQILKRTPEDPAHFSTFLYLEFRENPVPFCIIAAPAA